MRRLGDDCDMLLAACDGVSWEFEQRLGVMLAAMSRERADELCEAFGQVLAHRFDVDSPPVPIATGACDRLGGLRGGQMLLSTDPDARAVLFCAVWPWGGGDRVSLRVGLHFAEAFAAPDLIATWFARQ